MKTGLVMEGGAFRTIFSTGICDALLGRDVLPDYLVGVSAGVTYGTSYLSRQPRRNLEVLTQYANDKRYMGLGNLINPKNRCYFGLDFAYRRIPAELVPFDFDEFERYEGEVEAVVTNVDTGKPEYIDVPRRDEKFLLLQASCAIPLMFPTIYVDGKPYLDGGCSDPIPFRRAFEKGCDRVVVMLTRERDYVKKPESAQLAINMAYGKHKDFISAMKKRSEVYNQSREELFALEKEGKVIVLSPKSTKGFSRTEKDVSKIRALWKEGYELGLERLDEIEAFWKK